MLRTLRIAVSALSILTCALFIFFWTRSYRSVDSIQLQTVGQTEVSILSIKSRVLLQTVANKKVAAEWKSYTQYDERLAFPNAWWMQSHPGTRAIVLPYWFPVVMTGFAAVAPWILTRFNLRTMLLVLTFAAVVMGTIAYQVRQIPGAVLTMCC